jgi:superfamily I DNA/RNA helicase
MSETWWIKEEQLDDDQKAFASLGPDQSHLLIGPPGCGKTNLLLLRASYMYLAGHQNILVLVFTRTLQEFITEGTNAYQLPDGIVQTMHKWQLDFLRRYGVRVTPQGNTFEEKREFMANEVAELVESKKIRDVYDAMFLDEAHDYLPVEIQTFEKLGQVITAAADIHQKLYSGDAMDDLSQIVDQEHLLRFHYRLGQTICKLADGIKKNSAGYQPLLATSNYNEAARPSSVEVFPCKTLEEQVKKILEKLQVQMKAYPDELIGILCPRVEELEKIWELVSNSDVGSIAMKQGGGDHSSYADSKRIHVGTIHSAKGVEFRAAHLASIELVSHFPYEINMIYTAVTRAKTSLSLYHSGALPGYLRQALKSLEPLPPLPTTQELFGKPRKR